MAEEDDRRRGRPAEPPERKLGAIVYARVTEPEFDRLCQLASQQRQSLSAMVRDILRERLKP